jgi:hypothetical protein
MNKTKSEALASVRRLWGRIVEDVSNKIKELENCIYIPQLAPIGIKSINS